MELKNIAGRTITIELSPEEAMRLAVACQAAADHCCASGLTRDYGDLLPDADAGPVAWVATELYEATAAMFEAAALAAAADSYINDNPIRLDRLREGKLLGELWPVPRDAQPVT